MKWHGFAIALAAVSVHAAQDIPSARDLDGIDRYPRSWIVEYEEVAESLPYRFVTAPVDKIRQDLRIEGVRVTGPVQRVTYRIPEGEQLDDIAAHYQEILGAGGSGIVFSCEGQDCGRSTIWAHDVFGIPILVAPDRGQRFLAASITINGVAKLVAVYAVQRGNRRLYAHVEVVVPDEEVVFDTNRTLAETLARTGFAVIDGVVPDKVGALTEEELAKIETVAGSLGPFSRETIHVVCHLYGSESVDELKRSSERCAATAADILRRVGGVAAEAHGLGPLGPREALAKARLALVLPYRLRSE